MLLGYFVNRKDRTAVAIGSAYGRSFVESFEKMTGRHDVLNNYCQVHETLVKIFADVKMDRLAKPENVERVEVIGELAAAIYGWRCYEFVPFADVDTIHDFLTVHEELVENDDWDFLYRGRRIGNELVEHDIDNNEYLIARVAIWAFQRNEKVSFSVALAAIRCGSTVIRDDKTGKRQYYKLESRPANHYRRQPYLQIVRTDGMKNSPATFSSMAVLDDWTIFSL